MKLKKLLKKNKYKAVNWKLTPTNHILVKAKINGVKGLFILDTGASNSCVDFDVATHFKLTVKDSDTKAAGAGSTDLETKISEANKLQIADYKLQKISLVLMDLTHVNTALTQHNAKAVHGILGADVLLQSKAVIDYKKRQLFLR